MAKNEQRKKNVKVKLTNAELVTQFHPAITELASKKLNNLSAIMNVVKVKKLVDEKAKNFFELRKKIAEQGCVKDEQGQPISEGKMYVYENEEDKLKSSRLVKELEMKIISLEVSPLKISELSEIESVTPQTLISLREYIKE